MGDQCIVAKDKDGKAVVRSIENCNARVSPGRMREMFAYCLINGRHPTHIVEKGIEDTYYELRRKENEVNGVSSNHRDVVPIKLIVGDEDALASSGMGMAETE